MTTRSFVTESTPSKREIKINARQEHLYAKAQEWFDWAYASGLIIPRKRNGEIIGFSISTDFVRGER